MWNLVGSVGGPTVGIAVIGPWGLCTVLHTITPWPSARHLSKPWMQRLLFHLSGDLAFGDRGLDPVCLEVSQRPLSASWDISDADCSSHSPLSCPRSGRVGEADAPAGSCTPAPPCALRCQLGLVIAAEVPAGRLCPPSLPEQPEGLSGRWKEGACQLPSGPPWTGLGKVDPPR